MFINILHSKPKPKVKTYTDIHVECIVYELSDVDDILKEIRSRCHELNIIFVTRKYNSNKYSNDRYYVTSLPAFHIFIKNNYKCTTYPNKDPLKTIKTELSIYNQKIREKIKMIEMREKYYNDLYEWIKSLFKNKTALERAEEIKREYEKNKNKMKNTNEEIVNEQITPLAIID